jgi:exodeoxyribonuclease VII large subunit
MQKNNIAEYSVSEFSRSIKRVVEDAFGYVKITGEITSFKKASSGHLYFSLKDEEAILSAVCFKNIASQINFEIADGLAVSVYGEATTFANRSNYQIIIDKIEISGIGAILEMIEKRRKKLEAEGLFDVIHKKKLPFFPSMIGVITSETGAVLQDIKHRISERCPTHLKIYPVSVQGEKAANQIIKAIKYFNQLKQSEKPEVIIIARGGGSFEDLLPFNDEDLVRAVFKSEIPIISAIGHETDTTLIDYAADLRAPTPTAAAEIATPILSDLKNSLNYFSEKIKLRSKNYLQNKSKYLADLSRFIVKPEKLLERIAKDLDKKTSQISFLLKNSLTKKTVKLNNLTISKNYLTQNLSFKKHQVENLTKNLAAKIQSELNLQKIKIENHSKIIENQSYQKTLSRGFAIIRNNNQKVISSVGEIDKNFSVIMSDGIANSYLIDKEKKLISAKNTRLKKDENLEKSDSQKSQQLKLI